MKSNSMAKKSEILTCKCPQLLFLLFLIVCVRGPAIFRKLFAELFRTLFDFGGTGGGSLDLEQIFKDGLKF